jgi:hypothetical protein
MRMLIIAVQHSGAQDVLCLFLNDLIGTHQEIHTENYQKAAESTTLPKAECVHALKGLALPRASHSGEIALAGSRRLRSAFASAPVL